MITSGAGYRHQGTPALAATWASRGIATIAIAAEGFGFGPLGSLRTNFTDGTSLTIPDAGRSYDQDGNNLIATDEGIERGWRSSCGPSGASDTHKQTVIDLLQLAARDRGRDGRGRRWIRRHRCVADLVPRSVGRRPPRHDAGGSRPEREPRDPQRMLCHVPEYGRWNVNQRSAHWSPARRQSPVADQRGRAHLDRRRARSPPPYFNENKPLRNRPTVVNTVAGAIEIQEAFEIARVGTADRDEFVAHLAALPHARGRSPAMSPQDGRGLRFQGRPERGQSIRERGCDQFRPAAEYALLPA